MILSRYTLKNISSDNVVLPDESIFELPEKVLQFGTGVLLRALPDYFIDNANRQGHFNGRVVVVKSTSSGDVGPFEKQDGLYTICVRGEKKGYAVKENIVNASISRVLNANTEWEQVLECAHNLAIQVIVSNTTEVGIQLVNEDIRQHPPKSFPGKLLAFLYERFQAFKGSEHSGMVIVPTELIPENGKKLEAIVLELAHLNGLEDEFIEWLERANRFCNSLVDRIVPGKPDNDTLGNMEEELGYSDSLLTMCEPYALWAIEGDEKVKEILSFGQPEDGLVIEPDITIYRELKLRLLNGVHTLSAGPAYLKGCRMVKDAMKDELLSGFMSRLMKDELAPAIPYNVDAAKAIVFADQVLERFRNTSINHQWVSITVNYSAKMKMRCIPLLLKHYSLHHSPPPLFTLAFAAYIYFMRATTQKEGKYFGETDGETYLINDEMAQIFFYRWKSLEPDAVVQQTLADPYWATNLLSLPGFQQGVTQQLKNIMEHGIKEAMEEVCMKKAAVA
jgi:tagaturonate reductase